MNSLSSLRSVLLRTQIKQYLSEGKSFATKTSSLDFSDKVERNRREISTATALVSLSGPCRRVGNLYLETVSMGSLGRSDLLRANFEECAKTSAAGSIEILEHIGERMAGHIESKEDKLIYAAQLINLHNQGILHAL
jgi:hypothetical protein